MSLLIWFVLAYSSYEAREKRENCKNENILPSVGLEPTTSRLLDRHANQLDHRTVLNVGIIQYLNLFTIEHC